MNLGLSIELRPSRVELSHVSHSFCIYFAFFFEFKEDSVEFVVDRGSGVFIKYGVAARGFYMFFNFVNVLLVV